MNAHIGLCSASALSTISPVTDLPCGVSIVITFLGFGFNESAARSSFVDAFMRMVRPSMPEKVPLEKTTTLSPGRIIESTQSTPLKPVPATP
jgi:hypothetical protein